MPRKVRLFLSSCLLRLILPITVLSVLFADAEADTISTVAGSGTAGFNSDGIAATTAQINPEGGGWVCQCGH